MLPTVAGTERCFSKNLFVRGKEMSKDIINSVLNCAVCVCADTCVSDSFNNQLDFIKRVWDDVKTSMIHCLELAKNRILKSGQSW